MSDVSILSAELVVDDKNATATIDGFTKKLRLADTELNHIGGKTTFGKGITDNLSAAEKQAQKTRAVIAEMFSPSNLAGGAAAGAFAAFGKQAFDAAREGANAQLVLRAATVETGIAYNKLAESAEKFGAQTLQSNRAAQASFASIVNFAQAAGRAEKLDEFRNKFADLAAAKGIDPKNLGDIARQLNALTDEATDRLLAANPSAFYDKFAKSIGKTADSLTDAEKRAAVFDEILRRGALFTGMAEQKINASASALDRLNKKFEDAKEKAGAAIIPLVEFVEAATKATNAFSSANSTNDFIKNLSTNPALLPITLGLNLADNATRKVSDLIYGNNLQREITVSVKYAENFANVQAEAERLRKSDAEIRAAQANPLANFDNFALSKVNLATGFFSEAERQKAIGKARDEAQKFIDSLRQRLENPGAGGNLGLLKMAQREFREFANLFDSEARYKIQQSFATAISEGAAKGFRASLQSAEFNPKRLSDVLSQVRSSAELSPDTRQSLVSDITARIEQTAEKIKTAKTEFIDLMASARGENPFVKIFNEIDAAGERAEKRFGSLGARVVTMATEFDRAQSNLKLFETRLDNSLAALDLREQASRFRNPPQAPESPEARRFRQAEVINPYLRGYATNAGNDYLRRNKLGGQNLTPEQQQVLFEYATFYNVSKNGMNPADFVGYLARGRRQATESEANFSLQQKIDKQLRIINSSNPQNVAEQDAAYRRIAALGQGLNPLDLTGKQREEFAAAFERQAQKRESYESDALKAQQKTNELLVEVIKALGKGATGEAQQALIRIIDETKGAVAAEVRTPSYEDTTREYGRNLGRRRNSLSVF